jgi:hypothetical protein
MSCIREDKINKIHIEASVLSKTSSSVWGSLSQWDMQTYCRISSLIGDSINNRLINRES